MTPSLTPEMRHRVVEAYLGHRLNHNELVKLMGKVESAAPDVEDVFRSYSARKTDLRSEMTSDQLVKAWDGLGLSQQLASLDEKKVWTAQERAIYRRLSYPQNDPSTARQADPPTTLDAQLLATAERSFASWDRDGNIRLERQEIDYLMSGGFRGEKLDVANDPEKAAALATMARYHDLLGSGVPSDGIGISQADLIAWGNRGPLADSGLMVQVNETYQEYLGRAKTATAGSLLDEEIAPEHLTQGVIGSCVLLATTLGLSATDLLGIMIDNYNGSFEVAFADGVRETVHEPSLAERLFHSHGKGADRWPAVLEIAAAQRLFGEGKRAEDGLRGVIEGIDPEFAIPALTGRPADKRSIDELSLVQTRALLVEAQASEGPVICGSRPTANGDFINVEELHNGVANGHCYSIQSFDPMTDKVVLRNPWHKGEWTLLGADGSDDGKFEMPLKDFYTSFRWITFARSTTDSSQG